MDTIVTEMEADRIRMIEQVDRSELVEAEYMAGQSSDGRSLTLRRLEKSPPERIGPWSAEDVDQRIADWKPQIESEGLLLGAFRGEKLIGFAALSSRVPDGSAELLALFVDAKHRRLGVGSLLMEAVEDLARQRGIRALLIASNRTASSVEFYLKHGCKAITLRNNSVIRHGPEDPVFAKQL